MFLTFRSELQAALLAGFLLAGSVAPAAAAKRISIPLGAPPDVAADSAASIARRSLELPLWVGVEIGGGTSHASWGGLDDVVQQIARRAADPYALAQRISAGTTSS